MRTTVSSVVARGRCAAEELLADHGRLVRFACTGGLAALTQLALLDALLRAGWSPLLAAAIAFILAAQVNFALSDRFTWRDRRGGRLVVRWALFHTAIAGTAVLNLLTFAGASIAFPHLIAAVLGIAVAALGNFLLGDRIVFRPGQARETRSPVEVVGTGGRWR